MVTFNSITYPFNNEQALARQTRNSIATLKPQDRNLELKVILIKQTDSRELKNRLRLTQFQAADATGSVLLTLFGDIGPKLRCGDILYMEGAYVSVYNKEATLYTGKKGTVYRIGRFYMTYKEKPNISDKKYEIKDTEKVAELS